MAKYTETLHKLLLNEETNILIQQALSSYPLYQPVNEQFYGFIPDRVELNNKILNHYRWYEIGSETVERFLFNLETAMNEIMPYYNQLYKSIDIMNGVDDIFKNLDVIESFDESTSSNTTNKSNENMSGNVNTNTSENTDSKTSSNVNSENETNTDMSTRGRNVKNNTPQSQLQVKDIDSITAASEIGWNEDKSNSKSNSKDSSESLGTSSSESTGSSKSDSSQETNTNSTGESKGLTTHTLKRSGNQGVNTYAHDMLEFRNLFMNIEQKIIHDPELEQCFMLIW